MKERSASTSALAGSDGAPCGPDGTLQPDRASVLPLNPGDLLAEQSHLSSCGRRKNSEESKREDKEKDQSSQLSQKRSYSVSSFIRRGSTKKMNDSDLQAAQRDEKQERAMRDFEASMTTDRIILDSFSGGSKENNLSPKDASTSSGGSSRKKTHVDEGSSTHTKGLDLRQVVPTLHGRRRGKSDTRTQTKTKPKSSWLPLVSRRKNSIGGQSSLYCSDDMHVMTHKGTPSVLHLKHRISQASGGMGTTLRLEHCNLGKVDAQKLGKFSELQSLYLGYNLLQ